MLRCSTTPPCSPSASGGGELRKRKGAIYPARVTELDLEHDRLLGAIQMLALANEAGQPGAPSTVAANKINSSVFSDGLPPLIHIDFVQEREQTSAWLDRFHGDLAPEINAIGARHLVELLAAVVEEFGQLLDENKPDPELTYDQLRADDLVGHDMMLRFVAAVCAKHVGTAPGDLEARAALLRPIFDQNAVLTDLYRRGERRLRCQSRYGGSHRQCGAEFRGRDSLGGHGGPDWQRRIAVYWEVVDDIRPAFRTGRA